MRAGTNEWQRVDNVGCFPTVLRVLLLAWIIVVPYAAMTGNRGWLLVSVFCVVCGMWMTWQQRRQRRLEIPEMTVDVAPSEVHPGEQVLVSLGLGGDKAYSVRWWSAELVGDVVGDDPKAVASGEFAVDPEAEAAPVAELQMVLTVPDAISLQQVRARKWFVQVMVETERGRMESGRVPLTVRA